MSHPLKLLIILLLLLSSIVILVPTSSAGPTEPDPIWIRVSWASTYVNVSGPHFIVADTVIVNSHTELPSWIDADEVDVRFTNTTSPGLPSWVFADSVSVKYDTKTTWVSADIVDVKVDTATTWQLADGVYIEFKNEFTWQNVSLVSVDYRVDESTSPQVKPVSSSWLSFMLYMIILWLPGMILGLIAPYYGQIICAVLMGIMVYMSHTDFLMVLFVIIMGSVVMLFSGGDEG